MSSHHSLADATLGPMDLGQEKDASNGSAPMSAAPAPVLAPAPDARSSRQDIPLTALLAVKDALLAALARDFENRPVAKCRAGMRQALAPVVAGLIPSEFVYGALVPKARFDVPGTHVWSAICQALCSEDPKSLQSGLAEAFSDAEKGLAPDQIAAARSLIDRILSGEPAGSPLGTPAWRQKEVQEGINRRQNDLLRKEANRARVKAEQAVAAIQRAEAEAGRAAAAVLAAERAVKKLEKDRADYLKTSQARAAQGDIGKERFYQMASDHKRLFAKTLSLAAASKLLGLHKENRAALEISIAEDKKRAAIAEKAAAKVREAASKERQKERQWRDSLVFSTDVPKRLSITPAEYRRWLGEGKLVPSLMREFHKWGKNLEVPLFDPKALAKITPAKMAKWRAVEAKASKEKRSKSAVAAGPKTKKTMAIKKSIALEDFAKEFKAARSLGREFELCLGPTNSGKTHHAIEALILAKSGVYLAPLRLLALENYERLKAAGVAVSLMTGEERVIDAHATHVCATVEMCDFATAVDVAVIDEAQMIADGQRGWAWVSAILGAPAKRVYVCGAPYAGRAVEELLSDTGEPFVHRAFERLTPLTARGGSISLHEARPGDAVIAFSRRDVLNFAALLKQRGLGVSVIYGALSPEVRRRQARAFIDGVNQVVVATDAIGMGLNLPIRRIVFSAASKYDGTCVRELTSSEIQQIAGRAGRFGLHDEGFVTAFGANDLAQVRRGLACGMPDMPGAPFPVMPTWLHVRKILLELEGGTVREALELFERVVFKGLFKQADLKDTLARLDLVEAAARLAPRAAFALATAPADPAHGDDAETLSAMAWAVGSASVADWPMAPFSLGGTKPSSRLLEEAEAYSRQMALYSWFACKFPESADVDGFSEEREALAEFIDACLLDHKTAFFKQRKKQYRWSEEWDDGDDD